MPFIRLCDNYIDHPKFLALSDRAFRLWHEGMAHCRRYLTDGLIAAATVRGFRYHSKTAVAELTASREPNQRPLWEKIEGFGVKIHDYLEWNPSKAVEHQRMADARKRTAKWRHSEEGDASSDASRDASSDAYVPVRLGIHTSVDASKEERSARFDAFWERYPKKVGKDAARRAFDRRSPDAALLNAMLAALDRQCREPSWLKDGGQFIPHPSTWLNQGRWMDETPPAAVQIGAARRWSLDACPHAPPCGNATNCATRSTVDAYKASR